MQQPMGYKFELGLAHTKILIYKKVFVLKLSYKLKVYKSRFSLIGLIWVE